MRLTAFTLGLTVVLGMAGMACDESPISPSDVIGDMWRLTSLQRGDSTSTIDDPNRYTVRFNDQDRIEIKSDCNSCGGMFSLNGSPWPCARWSARRCSAASNRSISRSSAPSRAPA